MFIDGCCLLLEKAQANARATWVYLYVAIIDFARGEARGQNAVTYTNATAGFCHYTNMWSERELAAQILCKMGCAPGATTTPRAGGRQPTTAGFRNKHAHQIVVEDLSVNRSAMRGLKRNEGALSERRSRRRNMRRSISKAILAGAAALAISTMIVSTTTPASAGFRGSFGGFRPG